MIGPFIMVHFLKHFIFSFMIFGWSIRIRPYNLTCMVHTTHCRNHGWIGSGSYGTKHRTAKQNSLGFLREYYRTTANVGMLLQENLVFRTATGGRDTVNGIPLTIQGFDDVACSVSNGLNHRQIKQCQIGDGG